MTKIGTTYGRIGIDTVWSAGIVGAVIIGIALMFFGVKHDIAFGVGYAIFFFSLFGLCGVKCGRVILGKGTQPNGAPYQTKDKIMAVITALMTIGVAAIFAWFFYCIFTTPQQMNYR